MKRIEKLSITIRTELRNIVRDRTSKAVETRRAQVIILVNEECL